MFKIKTCSSKEILCTHLKFSKIACSSVEYYEKVFIMEKRHICGYFLDFLKAGDIDVNW